MRLEIPVEEVARVGLRPVTILRDANLPASLQVVETTFVGADAGGNFAKHSIGIFGMATGLAVCAPLNMNEPLDAVAFREQASLVLTVGAPVPTSPDRWRIDIRDVACE